MRGLNQSSAVFLLAGIACAPPPRDEQLKVEAPFAMARVWRKSLYARLTPGTPLETVIRFSIAPLVGGMTLEEARALAGPPLSSATDSFGTYYVYGSEASGVRLVHMQYKDSGPVDKWVVTAEPSENAVEALLSPELATLLASAGPIEELVIHERQRPRLQAFSAFVESGRLVHLQWYSIEGIPGG